MKKILAATLALTLLGATAATAAPYGHSYYRGGDNGGAIVAGIGLLALAGILASQHHDYDRDYGRYDRDHWNRNDYRGTRNYGHAYTYDRRW